MVISPFLPRSASSSACDALASFSRFLHTLALSYARLRPPEARGMTRWTIGAHLCRIHRDRRRYSSRDVIDNDDREMRALQAEWLLALIARDRGSAFSRLHARVSSRVSSPRLARSRVTLAIRNQHVLFRSTKARKERKEEEKPKPESDDPGGSLIRDLEWR